MDTQIPAFYDDHFHALRAAIESGAGYKATAAHLWPAMKPESAYARLKHCTSGNHGEKLDLAETLAVMAFNGRYDPLYYLCDETLHPRPVQRQAAEAAQTLAAQIAANIEATTKMNERLASLVAANPAILRAVS